MKKEFRLELDNNTTLVVETGRLAQQTNGSALITINGTQVLATACMDRKPQNVDFLPLTVSYQEKYYASGLIAHSKVNKREGRPTDDKVLMARVIDRTIRPIFPKGFNHSAQVMLNVLSYDQETEHDIVSGLGASVALSISDIPFEGPTAMVRVGLIDGNFVLNPTVEQRLISKLDLIVSSTEKAVIMIEAQAHEIPEEQMAQAIEFGFAAGQKICRFIQEIVQEIGKSKMNWQAKVINPQVKALLSERYGQIIRDTIFDESLSKLERFGRFDDLEEEASAALQAELNADLDSSSEDFVSDLDVKISWEKLVKSVIRKAILEEGKRIKGRAIDQIRPLSCELDILKQVHGSALFNRGETQGLSVVTLAGPEAKLYKTGMEGEKQVRYFHHYNFPPFSVGEVSKMLSTGNREIGHGALAEKALIPVLPDEKDFPYTMRVVSEILSSNGSSSMAATCGSTLALMAAGVPLKSPVSGIAMGLMTDEETGKYQILTDLQDEEDFGGDMDFKVAGTKDGITAIQMDIKLKGLPMNIFREAFERAYKGRMQVMEVMMAAISEPRKQVSANAPRIEAIQIDVDKIRDLIGKGGETINKLIDDYGVAIDINQSGIVTVTGNGEGMDQALERIKLITAKPEIGKI
ncbi:MAG TPA: polyribonucleotide nucleotidyltransferase, partial [Candidatus Gracilibacteria bacterium]|nr:polyribonucleotide nucleotidyltransferase [Candidatus Gracilibacteria bacterium]